MPRKYSEEFKNNLVNLYNEGHRSKASLSREYEVHQTTIGKWIKELQVSELEDGSKVSAAEYKRMKKDLETLKEENEILKAAAVLLEKH